MALSPGKIYQFKVDRQTPIGYMLTNHDDELFLHNKEAIDIQPGDVIEAFVYIDAYKRLAATMKKPLLTLNQQGWLKVVSRHPSLGVFLNLGIQKDVLLSADELPLQHRLWPDVGDQVHVILRVKNRLLASFIDPQLKEGTLEVGTQEALTIYKYVESGLKSVTQSGIGVFIHESQYDKKPRLGEVVNGKIIYHSDKGYSASITPQKEVKRLDDADLIFEAIQKDGMIPLDAQSTPEDISKYFKMSKKAFKRALGHLYKTRKVVFKEGKTFKVEDYYG